MQAGVTQRALADIRVIDTVAGEFMRVVDRQQFISKLGRQRAGQRVVHRRDGLRIDGLEQLGDLVLRRQRQDLRRQRRIDGFVKQDRAESVRHVQRQRQRLLLLITRDVEFDMGGQQALRRIPA